MGQEQISKYIILTLRR